MYVYILYYIPFPILFFKYLKVTHILYPFLTAETDVGMDNFKSSAKSRYMHEKPNKGVFWKMRQTPIKIINYAKYIWLKFIYCQEVKLQDEW